MVKAMLSERTRPLFTVILKGVPPKVKLEEVKKAFAVLDDVVRVHHIDKLPNTILCQFSESITPMLLDSEHSVEDSYWEVIQIDECYPPKPLSGPLREDVVPLAHAIGDMTVNFREQVNELALTYNISPTTLRHVAVNHICGKGEDEKGPVTSTPASALKTQTSPSSRSVASSDASHPVSASQTPNDTLLVNPLPADVQRVIVEHIVKHDSPVHLPPTRELSLFSGNSPKPSTEVDYGIWRLRAKQALNDPSLSEAQQRRMLLDSLLTPALNVALSIGAQASPSAYLHELDKAYGNVTGGEELYIQFLETHQNSGERASDYLRRLQTLLQEVVEGNGVAKQDADSQLLKQFLRGCWDDSLITTLHLKEPLNVLPKSTLTFSQLLFKIRTFEKESQLKEMRKRRHMGGVPTKVHTKTHIATQESGPSCHNVSPVLDAHNREQLEERIRQLEAELRKNACAQNDHPPRNDRPVRKFPYRAKGNPSAPSVPVVRTENLTKVGNFCYNCGDDSHMLPQCTNPTDAVLVQKKLCERHQARLNQRPLNQQQTNLQPDLSLNR